jgi:hypothetical protein
MVHLGAPAKQGFGQVHAPADHAPPDVNRTIPRLCSDVFRFQFFARQLGDESTISRAWVVVVFGPDILTATFGGVRRKGRCIGAAPHR